MPKLFRTNAPAWKPAFLLASLLLLSGCSMLAKDKTAGANNGPGSFSLQVEAPPEIQELLLEHMELQRYRQLSDLRRSELTRLLGAADGNIRSLLGTLGYFSPTIELQLLETDAPAMPSNSTETSSAAAATDNANAAASGSAAAPGPSATGARRANGSRTQRTVLVKVDPGPPTRVDQATVDFVGVNANDPLSDRMRQSIERNWPLKPGETFTQQAWGAAKTDGLRRLQSRRYPTAALRDSRADIDTDTETAQVRVAYEPGPAYYFGPLVIEGAERYNPAGPIRLARLPVNDEYRQNDLLDAQQRLANSGLYDSVFLTLATDVAQPGDTVVQAPVIAQVREAKLQKWIYGLGFSTDTGPRLSIDHTHNRVPWLGWRALSKMELNKKSPMLSSRLTSMPDYSGWNYFVGGRVAREELADYTTSSVSVLGGRSKSEDKIDRTYFLQYDMAKPQGEGAPPSSSALTINYGWTGRYFNNPTNPTRGYGLGWEAGVGTTLTPQSTPFTRLTARALYLHPLGQAREGAARRSRLALRANAGGVLAKDDAVLPITQLFLSGGDTTVRGYSYQSLGARTDNGKLIGGRYMAAGSVEWQRPVTIAGNRTDWEHALFVDAGTVTDSFDAYKLFVGVGSGIRWRSPVGPLQADLAYGLETRKLRLHLRLGFTF